MATLPPTEWEVRIADLVAASVPVTWHEAVAVVREVARQAMAAGVSSAVPAASQITLRRDGTVTLGGLAGAATGTVAGLAGLLQILLPGDAPEALQRLTEVSIPGTSPQEFIAALTYFARPDDKAELVTLAERALTARESAERAAALAALTDRARHGADQPEPTATPARKSLRVRGLGVAAMLVASALAAAAGAWRFAGAPTTVAAQRESASTPAARVAQRVQSRVASAFTFVTESLTTSTTVPSGRGKDIALPRRRLSIGANRSVPMASPTEAPPLLAAPAEPERPREPFAAAHIGALLMNDGVSHGLAVAPHGLYSASHPDVIPPALLRAQMPGTPIEGLPRERPGALELMVDEGGHVLSAKLLPASNRHQDRMMVSAAKTWRFAPATRNGQAVSYRLLLPITW